MEAEKRVESESSKVDVAALMAEIRAEVIAALASETREGGEQRSWPKAATKAADFSAPSRKNGASAARAGELTHSEDLRWLNTHYSPAVSLDLEKLSSHRPGPVAKVLKKLKAKILVTVWDYLFKDLLADIRDYRAAQVRLLNDAVRYVDERDAALFWELIHKLDHDSARVSERVERIGSELGGDLRQLSAELRSLQAESKAKLDERVARLESEIRSHGAEVKALGEITNGLESTLSRYSRVLQRPPSASESSESDALQEQPEIPDLNYLLLENRFRGSEAEIRSRLNAYAPYLRKVDGTVLEIGPGRGEFLELCRELGVDARGVDLDQAMVDRCGEKGLAVVHGDGIAALASQAPNSLGGVFAFQVVEHLSATQVEQLVSAAMRALRPGGVCVFETINPLSITALSSNYFRDPTHVAPQHPDTLRYLFERGGFVQTEITLRSPISESEKLALLAVEDFMTPKWRQFIHEYNGNIAKLNDLLFGEQDFSIAAYVPLDT